METTIMGYIIGIGTRMAIIYCEVLADETRAVLPAPLRCCCLKGNGEANMGTAIRMYKETMMKP